MKDLITGGNGGDGWGDYVRNRPFQPSQVGGVTSAWI